MNTIKFYDLKTRQHVDIPAAEVTKAISKRTLKSGKEQDRYQLKAKYDGRTLFKFVSEATFAELP